MEPAADVVLVVDVANLMGSRPDGWWRDRAAAATRLLEGLARLGGAADGPQGERLRIGEIVAVLEGRAVAAADPGRIRVVRTGHDGDAAVVEEARGILDGGHRPLVVTADRGLRARLPVGAQVAGPGWLNRLLGR